MDPPKGKQGSVPFCTLICAILRDPNSVPRIRLVHSPEGWWSLDNHRLWALQLYEGRYPSWDAAAYFRSCKEVEESSEEFQNKRTTQCEGRATTLRIKGCQGVFRQDPYQSRRKPPPGCKCPYLESWELYDYAKGDLYLPHCQPCMDACKKCVSYTRLCPRNCTVDCSEHSAEEQQKIRSLEEMMSRD